MNKKLSSVIKWGSIVYLVVVLPNMFVIGHERQTALRDRTTSMNGMLRDAMQAPPRQIAIKHVDESQEKAHVLNAKQRAKLAKRSA